jgi:hypothetical protein
MGLLNLPDSEMGPIQVYLIQIGSHLAFIRF